MAHTHSAESATEEPPGVKEEREHFQRVLQSYKHYVSDSNAWIARMESSYEKLAQHHKLRIPKMKEKFNLLKKCVAVNNRFFQAMLASHEIFQGASFLEEPNEADQAAFQAAPAALPLARDMERVRSVLRQVHREWSEEGRAERDPCFQPLLREMVGRLPPSGRQPYRVLCPGVGLGRLAWEFARLGYASQGNEFSYLMLIASNFILNRLHRAKAFQLFPWIHTTSNVFRFMDMFKPAIVPDVNPSELPEGADFSMTAGEFAEVYGTEEHAAQWDAVATCFFIDTAKNVVEYVEVISNILRPGGVWVNIGPLLYHWADMEGEQSIEISYEELREVVKSFGLSIEKEERVACIYTQQRESMMRVVYDCVLFVAVKKTSSP